MKQVQVLFAACVALLAMSFTVASKTNILGHNLAKASVTAGCYTTVTLSGSTLAPANAGTDVCTPAHSCASSTVTFNGIPGTTLSSLPPVTATPGLKITNPAVTCNGTAHFCCYDVLSTGVIDKIFYKI